MEVSPVSSTVDTIKQCVYYVDRENKRALLTHILQDKSIETVLVFTRTKHGADKLVKQLLKDNIPAMAIHGNKSQNARQTALAKFKNKEIRVLIATDIAARGIDIDELSHVVNYELPNIPETYVHRIGRTGRAGLSGVAISFCQYDEIEYLKDIEKLIGKRVPVVQEHPYPLLNHTATPKKSQTSKQKSAAALKKHLRKMGNQSVVKTIHKTQIDRAKNTAKIPQQKSNRLPARKKARQKAALNENPNNF